MRDSDALFSLILVTILGVFLGLALLIFEKFGVAWMIVFLYSVPSFYLLVRLILE